MAEEEVHGVVQFGVNFDYDNHPNIPYYSDTVNVQENQESGISRSG
jgi:hypothetical protein